MRTHDIELTVRIPAMTKGEVAVSIAEGQDATWSLTPSGRFAVVEEGSGDEGEVTVSLVELTLTAQELELAWAPMDRESRIRLDFGTQTSGSEIKLEIRKSARVSVTVSSGARQESERGTLLSFTVHDQVQSPTEKLPTGPPHGGVLSLPA